MRTRAGRLAASALMLVLAACSSAEADDRELGTVDHEANDPMDGWRWESYHDVQLAVPEDWGYGVTPSRRCPRKNDETSYVGRPGAEPAKPCAREFQDDGQFVWFGVKESSIEVVQKDKVMSGPTVRGNRAAIQVGRVRVYVQAPASVRRRILDSIRFIDTDHHGCPVTAPYAGKPTWRPQGPEVTEYRDVKSISACRYREAQLVSSLRLADGQARAALAAITRAPKGGGPYQPAASCVPVEVEAEGIEQLLLQVDAATPGAISLRYGGCSSTGLDDGVTVRTLTRESVTPFLQGPNRPTQDYWALMTL